MLSIKELFRKGREIVRRRIGEQGLWVTLHWLFGRGLPALTGIPLLKYSRITPQLFVGPQYRKNGLKFLELEGIDAVISMRIEKDDSQFGLAPSRYCYLPTVDDEAPSLDHLAKGVTFISDIIQNGGKVYIHCGAGVGRAPTMAAAYLMSTGLSLEDAIEKIRLVRPFIYIMPPQMEQLRRFESCYKLE